MILRMTHEEFALRGGAIEVRSTHRVFGIKRSGETKTRRGKRGKRKEGTAETEDPSAGEKERPAKVVAEGEEEEDDVNGGASTDDASTTAWSNHECQSCRCAELDADNSRLMQSVSELRVENETLRRRVHSLSQEGVLLTSQVEHLKVVVGDLANENRTHREKEKESSRIQQQQEEEEKEAAQRQKEEEERRERESRRKAEVEAERQEARMPMTAARRRSSGKVRLFRSESGKKLLRLYRTASGKLQEVEHDDKRLYRSSSGKLLDTGNDDKGMDRLLFATTSSEFSPSSDDDTSSCGSSSGGRCTVYSDDDDDNDRERNRDKGSSRGSRRQCPSINEGGKEQSDFAARCEADEPMSTRALAAVHGADNEGSATLLPSVSEASADEEYGRNPQSRSRPEEPSRTSSRASSALAPENEMEAEAMDTAERKTSMEGNHNPWPSSEYAGGGRGGRALDDGLPQLNRGSGTMHTFEDDYDDSESDEYEEFDVAVSQLQQRRERQIIDEEVGGSGRRGDSSSGAAGKPPFVSWMEQHGSSRNGRNSKRDGGRWQKSQSQGQLGTVLVPSPCEASSVGTMSTSWSGSTVNSRRSAASERDLGRFLVDDTAEKRSGSAHPIQQPKEDHRMSRRTSAPSTSHRTQREQQQMPRPASLFRRHSDQPSATHESAEEHSEEQQQGDSDGDKKPADRHFLKRFLGGRPNGSNSRRASKARGADDNGFGASPSHSAAIFDAADQITKCYERSIPGTLTSRDDEEDEDAVISGPSAVPLSVPGDGTGSRPRDRTSKVEQGIRRRFLLSNKPTGGRARTSSVTSVDSDGDGSVGPAGTMGVSEDEVSVGTTDSKRDSIDRILRRLEHSSTVPPSDDGNGDMDAKKKHHGSKGRSKSRQGRHRRNSSSSSVQSFQSTSNNPAQLPPAFLPPMDLSDSFSATMSSGRKAVNQHSDAEDMSTVCSGTGSMRSISCGDLLGDEPESHTSPPSMVGGGLGRNNSSRCSDASGREGEDSVASDGSSSGGGLSRSGGLFSNWKENRKQRRAHSPPPPSRLHQKASTR